MLFARLTVELPPGMPPAALRELLEMNGIRVRDLETQEESLATAALQPASVRLTPAELAVLRAFTSCDTREEVARGLGVRPATVKSHTKNLFVKLRVRSRAFAVGRALRLGLLSLQDLTSPPEGGEISPGGRMDE